MAYLQLFKIIWSYSRNFHSKIILFFVLHIVSNAGALASPWIFAQVINVIQINQAELLREVIFWLGIWLILFSTDAITHRLGRIVEFQVSYRVYRRFVNTFYVKATRLPLKWHVDHHSGSVINRIKTAATALKEFIESHFHYIGLFVRFWGPLAGLSLFSPEAAVIAFVISVMSVFLIYFFDLKLVKLYQELNENKHHVASGIFDYISNMKTIITLKLGRKTAEELDQRIADGYHVHIQSEGLVNGYKWTSLSFLIFLLKIAIILQFVWSEHTAGSVILVGTLVGMYQYLERLSESCFGIAGAYQQILGFRVDYQAIQPLEEAEERSSVAESAIRISDWQQMLIKNLYYAHEDSRADLQIEDLAFYPREKIALVGESGSGKSTLLALLRGLYDPSQLSLEIDQQKFTSFSPLFQSTTLLPQEPEIFENTIRFNLTFGLSCSDQELSRVIEIARLEKVIAKMPEGLDTDIREKGVNLSGGERQRLSLARGILAASNSPIILMDEPTSSVDPENELLIYQQLLKQYEDRLVLSALHRLHLLNLFDRVIVLDNGQVVQTGNFEELKNTEGKFKELWEKFVQEK